MPSGDTCVSDSSWLYRSSGKEATSTRGGKRTAPRGLLAARRAHRWELPSFVALLAVSAFHLSTARSSLLRASVHQLAIEDPSAQPVPEPKPPAPTQESKSPPDTYAYSRSDLDPNSPFFVPASLRYSHLGAGPVSGPALGLSRAYPYHQRFQRGSRSGATPDKIKSWRRGFHPAL